MQDSFPSLQSDKFSLLLNDPTIPIFIIGYMASGKTTFGKALAKALGREFVDLDFYIEQRFRKSISAIFADEGEEAFRKKEAAMLRETGGFYNAVIACGGGTPCFHSNMDFMKSSGLTVWLTTTVERIVERLLINNGRRPLIAGKSEAAIRTEVNDALVRRTPFYNQAHVAFSGEHLEDRRQIADSVASFLSSQTPD